MQFWLFALLPTFGLVAGQSLFWLFFIPAGIQGLTYWYRLGRVPKHDPILLPLALIFLALAWASISWSPAPAQSARYALLISLSLLGSLLFLGTFRPIRAGKVLDITSMALVLGSVIALVDTATGWEFQALILQRPGESAVVKYHRGVSQSLLLAWPLLAWLGLSGKRLLRGVLAALFGLTLIAVGGDTGRLAALLGLVTFALANVWPFALGRIMPWLVAIGILTLPVALQGLASQRVLLATWIKPSGLHRLELWDFMSARALERPIFGWGMGTSGLVPIWAEELAGYAIVRSSGLDSHNQWLELWIALGLAGIACAAGLMLVILRRIRLFDMTTRPYAYAAFVSALTISCLNFEVVLPAWWAAIAASAGLFSLIGRVRPEPGTAQP